MKKLTTLQTIETIETAFKDAGIKLPFNLKTLLDENSRFINRPRAKRRYIPILPTTIEGKCRYYNDSDVKNFAQKLIEISTPAEAR
ncbi:MAG: hypothetical protein WBI40_13050 [Methylococcaceae bacterium]